MFIYIFIAVLVTAWVWLAYEINKAPLYEEEEDIDDPTTTFWHEDDDN
jgi:hypothetical protein